MDWLYSVPSTLHAWHAATPPDLTPFGGAQLATTVAKPMLPLDRALLSSVIAPCLPLVPSNFVDPSDFNSSSSASSRRSSTLPTCIYVFGGCTFDLIATLTRRDTRATSNPFQDLKPSRDSLLLSVYTCEGDSCTSDYRINGWWLQSPSDPRLAECPSPISGMAATLGPYIYVGGGFGIPQARSAALAVKRVFCRLDTQTGQWERLEDIPSSIHSGVLLTSMYFLHGCLGSPLPSCFNRFFSFFFFFFFHLFFLVQGVSI